MGCDVSPAKLAFEPTPPSQKRVSPALQAARAHLRVESLKDVRTDRDNLGSVAGRPFSSVELMPLIDAQLRGAITRQFIIDTDQEALNARVCTIQPRLLKAYVGSISTSKYCVVVLECEFSRPDGSTSTKIYRGQDQSLNWSSGEGEVRNSILRALNTCLRLFETDLEDQVSAGSK
jgi:hypothetical protein